MLTVLLATLLVPASSQAAFPGVNGKIAFVRAGDIWTMNPDGTGQVNLTTSAEMESSPAWSADGQQIAFASVGRIWRMYADGTGRTPVTNISPNRADYEPAWSPDGQKIAFGACCPPGHDLVLMTVNVDGTGEATIGENMEGIDWPDWSPDGSKIVSTYWDNCAGAGLWWTNPTGTASGFITGSMCRPMDITDLSPSWSPDAQRIVFASDAPSRATTPHSIWTIKPDGTDAQQLTTSPDFSHEDLGPVWSPDQTKIAFTRGGRVQVMNSNGAGIVDLTDGDAPDWQPLPAAGPGADVLSTITDSPDPIPAGGILTYTASAKNLVGPDDASGVTLTVTLPASVYFVSATPSQGSCAQASGTVTCNLANLTVGSSASATIQVEPQTPGTINATANATATESDPVPANNASNASTTVSFGGYPRPKGAEISYASLVPAYRECEPDAATLTHGPSLAFPSCGSPSQTSGYLTVGTPDANTKSANSVGFVRLRALGEGPPIDPNNGDQADVGYELSISDVRKASDLSDYEGELEVQATLRITDRLNTPSLNAPATVTDTSISFTAPCAPTPSTSIGASCSVSTTAEALVPGMVTERKRAIWALGRVRVFDGGADGDTATGPNTLFAVQGVFVP